MMRRFLLLAFVFGCGGDDECQGELPPGVDGTHQDLPSTDPEGNPWPTYTEASADLADCTQEEGYRRFRGACSDGKRFLYRYGGFTNDTRYYDGEALVGTESDVDVIMQCVDRSVGDSRCEEVDVEEIVCS